MTDTKEIASLEEEIKDLMRDVQALKDDFASLKENLYRLSEPGMKESILEGLKTALSESSKETDDEQK